MFKIVLIIKRKNNLLFYLDFNPLAKSKPVFMASSSIGMNISVVYFITSNKMICRYC